MLSVRTCLFTEFPAFPCTGPPCTLGIENCPQEELSHSTLLCHQREASKSQGKPVSRASTQLSWPLVSFPVGHLSQPNTLSDVPSVVLSAQQPTPRPPAPLLNKRSFRWQPPSSILSACPACPVAIYIPHGCIRISSSMAPHSIGKWKSSRLQILSSLHSTARPFHPGSCSAEGKG